MTEGLSREAFEEVAHEIFGIWVEAGRPGTPEWGVKAIADIIEAAASSLKQAEPELERLRFRLFYYAPFDGTSHRTSCTIWREDGQGHAEGFEGDRGPCNCGALENFERKRAEAAEAKLAQLEGKQAEPPSQPAKCPRCGQPKLYPGMACYGNEHEFHVAESPSPASTNTIEVLYHAARKAELEALRQRDAALLKLEHFKEAKEEWARRIAEKCEERDNKGEWPPTESDMLALMTNEGEKI